MTAPRFLQGVRVIDLSQYIPGPFATRQLADLGADVIKIEPPGGDPMRRFMHTDLETVSPIYRHLNRGKRILQLDLKSDSGKSQFSELLGDADILLESFRPGVLKRLGFDHDRIKLLNPKLIHCALSGYGQTGPYQLRVGHDINYCAGSAMLQPESQQAKPVIGFPPVADHAAALQASVMMLAALNDRDRKQGVFIDISLFETALSWAYLPLLADADQQAVEILSGGAACYNVYRCADDRYISLGAIETSFWQNFCNALQQPEWIERQFEPMPQAELIAAVSAKIVTQPISYWSSLLDDIPCCFETVYLPEELSGHPQIIARHALNHAGPNYPGWIDGNPPGIDQDFEEMSTEGDCQWFETSTV